MPIDAFGYLGGILEARFHEPHAPAGDPRDEIRQAAVLYGLDLPMMLSIAKVESNFNPRASTGSYKGLFQLGAVAFEKYGEGSIWDARDNARAAAHMILVQGEEFRDALGHYPNYAERYMIHQQGIEGAIEHYKQPERVAWRSMCATSEGIAKGEQWCKRCIWDNLLPQWKRDLGSVDRILSVDFVSHWTKRINLLANGYDAEKDAAAAIQIRSDGARRPAVIARNVYRLRQTAERKQAGRLAVAKIRLSRVVKVSIKQVRPMQKRIIRAGVSPLIRPADSQYTHQASAAR
jgi:Transglycosylase SLT domain